MDMTAPGSLPTSNGGSSDPGIALPAGATALDAVFQLHRIDPNVLNAIDQAHGSSAFSSYNDLVSHVEAVGSRGEAAFTGMVSQYKGYLGENLMAQHLREQGHHVELATEPNQAGWDALVDGEPVQIKVGGPETISEHLEKYPDIPVITVAENADKFAGEPMVMAVKELSGESIEEATTQTLQGIDGLDDVGLDFPVVTAVLSGARNLSLVASGDSDLGTAIKYTAADTVGVGAGGAAGAKAGTMIGGAIGGPIGAGIGAVIGGIGGAIMGRKGARHFKEGALREAEERLNCAVSRYPDLYGAALQKKAGVLEQTAREVQPGGLRATIWPSLGDTAGEGIAGKYREWSERCRAWWWELRKRSASPLLPGARLRARWGHPVHRQEFVQA